MLLKKQPKGDIWQGICRSVFFLLRRGPVARGGGPFLDVLVEGYFGGEGGSYREGGV